MIDHRLWKPGKKNEATCLIVMGAWSSNGDWSSNGVTGPGKAVRGNYRILPGWIVF